MQPFRQGNLHGERLRPAGCGRHPAGRGFSREVRECAAIIFPDSPTLFANGSVRRRLHAYLGGVVRNVNGVPEAIGGIADLVHLLIGLRSTSCLADVVRDVIAVSSRWVHEGIGELSFVRLGGETPPPRVAPIANASRGRRNASSKSKRNGED